MREQLWEGVDSLVQASTRCCFCLSKRSFVTHLTDLLKAKVLVEKVVDGGN